MKAILSKVSRGISLREYSTIKIGGYAEYFFHVRNTEDLFSIIRELNRPFYILGAGSNLLIKDGVIEKPVVKLCGEFNYVRQYGDLVEAGAAIPFNSLLGFCSKNLLSGVENLSGIPATIGGLLATGASSYGSSLFSVLVRVQVIDKEGKIDVIDRKDIEFSYRNSSLSDFFILRAWFRLRKNTDIKNNILKFIQLRIMSQDFDFPSCGCIFKNHNDIPAGFLIESCGLKGLSCNDAQVSGKHANFIINKGKAGYGDVDYLIAKIKDKVYAKHGVVLEEEIVRWT
ncbi:MAG: UDP-N-acetylmuramate dehydrogenase [Candidatus Omnitrophota bacterium]